MTKKIRLTILLACAACFFLITPFIIGYSLGYRVDLEQKKIVTTGGIYVRTWPEADSITIDLKLQQKPAFFTGTVFVQNLLPRQHTVLIQKQNYYDYSKILPVTEKEVTKLENVLLFKKDIQFETLADPTKSPFKPQTEKFIITKNNLYYSNAPENSQFTQTQKNTPVIKNILAFLQSGNNILWLGTDGFLYRSDIDGKNPVKLTDQALKIDKKGIYKIKNYGENIFLNADGQLLFLENKGFSAIADQADDFEISPDGHNSIFSSGDKVYLYTISADANRQYLVPKTDALLYQPKDRIKELFWLNNDYVIFSAGDEIIASEIDCRGKINSIVLPIQTKSPEIFFNSQEGKLYILSENTISVSEKLTQ